MSETLNSDPAMAYAEIRYKARLLKFEILLLVTAVVLSAVGIIGSDPRS